MVIFWLRGFIQASRSDKGDFNSPWNRPYPPLFASPFSLFFPLFRKARSNFPDIPLLCFIPVSLYFCFVFISFHDEPLSQWLLPFWSHAYQKRISPDRNGEIGKILVLRAVIMIGWIGDYPCWSYVNRSLQDLDTRDFSTTMWNLKMQNCT